MNHGLEINTQTYNLVFSWLPNTENPQPINLAGDSTIGKYLFLIAFDLIVINHFAYLNLQLSCFCRAQLDMIMLHGC